MVTSNEIDRRLAGGGRRGGCAAPLGPPPCRPRARDEQEQARQLGDRLRMVTPQTRQRDGTRVPLFGLRLDDAELSAQEILRRTGHCE